MILRAARWAVGESVFVTEPLPPCDMATVQTTLLKTGGPLLRQNVSLMVGVATLLSSAPALGALREKVLNDQDKGRHIDHNRHHK